MSGIDPATIFFAIVALFVAWRLRSVLGTKVGLNRPPATPSYRVVKDVSEPPPQERWRDVAAPGSPLARGLDAIAAADRNFDPRSFLAGARGAYEMIVAAFAAGDAAALGRLLAPEPLANFTRAIEARRAAGQTMTTTLISLDRAELTDASARSGVAYATVRFAAKINSVTKDSSGTVTDGAPGEIVEHNDLWTFSRPLNSPDPNWRLTATEAAAP